MRQTRLIDANGLMNLLERELDMNGITDWGKGYMDAIHDAMEHVKFMPTIETSKLKHGKWERVLIRNDKGGCIGAKMNCSVCNTDNGHDEDMKYCPNCGAIMDLDGE